MIPDLGSTWHLPNTVGRARAMGLAMLGDAISRQRLLEALPLAPSKPKVLTVGLYGDEAPKSVELFNGLCAGTLGSELMRRASR